MVQRSWLSQTPPGFAYTGPSQAGGPGGHVPPHFLSDQLTLSQPGGHIIPTQYYVPPRFSNLATALNYVIVKITVAHLIFFLLLIINQRYTISQNLDNNQVVRFAIMELTNIPKGREWWVGRSFEIVAPRWPLLLLRHPEDMAHVLPRLGPRWVVEWPSLGRLMLLAGLGLPADRPADWRRRLTLTG